MRMYVCMYVDTIYSGRWKPYSALIRQMDALHVMYVQRVHDFLLLQKAEFAGIVPVSARSANPAQEDLYTEVPAVQTQSHSTF